MTYEEALAAIAEDVKTLMGKLDIPINDRGIPTLKKAYSEVFGDTEILAIYEPQGHDIYVNMNKYEMFATDQNLLAEIMAHELTHAYQFLPPTEEIIQDVFADSYWEQSFEKEAYSIGVLWMTIFGPCKDNVLDDGEIVSEHYSNMLETQPKETILTNLTNFVRNVFKNQQGLN